MVDHPLTNEKFGELVGCHFTTSSRLRNGERLPSLNMMTKIQKAFDLPYDDLMSAYEGGAAVFGRYLSVKVFGEAVPS